MFIFSAEEKSHGMKFEFTLRLRHVFFGEFTGQLVNTLTLVPIKTDFIIKDLLSQDEIDWVNSFNKNVINKIGKHLSQDELTWLENYIR